MPQHRTEAPVELALQEFEVEQLDDLDAPGWSDFAVSFVQSVSMTLALT